MTTALSPLPDSKYLAERCLPHVLSRIRQTAPGEHPFRHAYIERILPDDVYDAVHAHMLSCKYGGDVQDRGQDSAAFTNKRTNLFESEDDVAACLRAVFSAPEIKLALLDKFYVSPSPAFAQALSIHEEFEYFYTEKDRVQNIHVDIPPKYLSFVFYIPERPITLEEEARNGTILYDKALRPHYPARFRPNSVCIFAPHFSTYHGFSTTIDRDVLVMFYVNPDDLRQWREARQTGGDTPPFAPFRSAVARKLSAHPLIEFAGAPDRLEEERSACLVNAPLGRVLTDENGRVLPVAAYPTPS
jgi:hypothetical protein